MFLKRGGSMKLSFKFNPKLNKLQNDIINELSFHTTKLYNIANYDCLNLGFLSYKDMNTKYNHNWHKDFLHSHNYQHCLKVLEKNWKSYFNAIKDYKKNPSKYLGEPKQPKYKNLNDKKNEVIFTNLAIRFKNNLLMLSLSKTMQKEFGVKSLNFEVSDKLQSQIPFNKLQQIKIKWDNINKSWYLILIYEKEETVLDNSFNNIMSIDLGLNNLASMTFLNNTENYIINGKPVKSLNSYVNNRISYLQMVQMKSKKTSKTKDTKQIKNLRKYRENYINNYFHKVSRQIISLAYKHNVKTIVIGDISLIKQEMNYNKSFVQLPLQRLVELIKYKAKLIGMEVKVIKESYTSGCSSLDIEPIDKAHYNKSRRIKRGLFKSNKGLLINADINGSLNILRLYVKDTSIPELIKIAEVNGFVNNPIKLRVA